MENQPGEDSPINFKLNIVEANRAIKKTIKAQNDPTLTKLSSAKTMKALNPCRIKLWKFILL